MSIDTKPIIAQQPGINGCDEDEIIAAARGNDCMRDELWTDWVNRQKQGPNPDEIPSDALGSAYRAMIERQRNTAPNVR